MAVGSVCLQSDDEAEVVTNSDVFSSGTEKPQQAEYSQGSNIYYYDGYDCCGYDQNGYDCDGYDMNGFNKRGFDRDGFYIDGCCFDGEGYDKNGFNEDGFNREGESLSDILFEFFDLNVVD